MSASMASKTSGTVATLYPNEAILGTGDSAYKFQGENEVYATTTERVLPIALRSTGSPGRGIMRFHHELLGHPYEELTRATTKANGVNLTGSWVPCEGYSKSKAHKMPVMKTRTSSYGL